MESLQLLSRSEMRVIKGGGESCSVTLTCPSGWTVTCGDDNYCHIENDGSYDGYINCGIGRFQIGCWQREPEPEVY